MFKVPLLPYSGLLSHHMVDSIFINPGKLCKHIFDIAVFLCKLFQSCILAIVNLSPFFLLFFSACSNMVDMAMMRYVESLVCCLK